MSHRIIGAVAALALSLVLAGSALATTAIRTGSTIGPVVPSGGTITSPIASGTHVTFITNAYNIMCTTDTISYAVGSSPSASSVSASLSVLSGSSCTDTGPVTGMISFALVSAGSGTIASSASGGTISSSSVVIRWTMNFGTCDYTASTLSGTYANTAGTLTFTNVPLFKSGGSLGCPSTATMSGTFARMTYGGANVYVATA
jgi:hypothetical protein